MLPLETLITQYGAAITRYCYGILCNYHDAQDAAQITFLKAYHKQAVLKDPADVIFTPVRENIDVFFEASGEFTTPPMEVYFTITLPTPPRI